MAVAPRIASSSLQPITGTGKGVIEAAPYQITVAMRDPPNHGVTLDLYEKPPMPAGGGGGWEEIKLPKRSGVLVWRGRELMTQTIEVVIDNVESDSRVFGSASPISTLLRMYRPDKGTSEPPVLVLSGEGNAVPYQLGIDWVLSNIEWGDGVADDQAERIQQVFTLTLTEYREDERLQTVDVEEAAKAGLPGGELFVAVYTWKKGDTLGSIADKYKVKGGWRALGNFQVPKINDPRGGKVGQLIFIPA